MIGTETTVIRNDADNCPMAVSMLTGQVDRPNTYYMARLKCEVARRVFLAWVGIVKSHEVPNFIAACNRAAGRKMLLTDGERAEAAMQYCGIAPKIEKKAGPHRRGCCCPRCQRECIRGGCRAINCRTCGLVGRGS